MSNSSLDEKLRSMGIRIGGPPQRSKEAQRMTELYRAGRATLRHEGGVSWYEHQGRKYPVD